MHSVLPQPARCAASETDPLRDSAKLRSSHGNESRNERGDTERAHAQKLIADLSVRALIPSRMKEDERMEAQLQPSR
jgi:hypothetical protein